MHTQKSPENKFILFLNVVSAPRWIFHHDSLLIIHQHPSQSDGQSSSFGNRDGSQASMCGNGLRTVSRYLAEQTHQKDFQVETDATDLPVHQVTSFAPNVPAFSVIIQPVSFDATSIGLHQIPTTPLLNKNNLPLATNSTATFSAVAVPNPHLIRLTDHNHPNALTTAFLGQQLNGQNPWFRDGVNVSFG